MIFGNSTLGTSCFWVNDRYSSTLPILPSVEWVGSGVEQQAHTVARKEHRKAGRGNGSSTEEFETPGPESKPQAAQEPRTTCCPSVMPRPLASGSKRAPSNSFTHSASNACPGGAVTAVQFGAVHGQYSAWQYEQFIAKVGHAYSSAGVGRGSAACIFHPRNVVNRAQERHNVTAACHQWRLTKLTQTIPNLTCLMSEALGSHLSTRGTLPAFT